MLPALRRMNSSPGSVCVIRFGLMRQSEQVMNSATGCWPAASLDVFGVVQHRRRPRRRGRKRHPRLKAPEGLCVGVVHKVRDAAGKLRRVQTRALFGRRPQIQQRVQELGIGQEINTAHVERLNGPLRGQQARRQRRTRHGSREEKWLQWSLWLWRDLDNWVRVHGSLGGRTPAQAQGLSEHAWSVQEYIRHPVHVSDLQRAMWAEERETAFTSALEQRRPKKPKPTS
jgi:hypothetical protein